MSTRASRVGLLICLAACGANPNEEDTARAEQAIVGGMPDAGDRAVVGIVGDDDVFCSGTLITPRVVITAAHCVSATASPLRVLFGSSVRARDAVVISTEGAAAHPAFLRDRRANDIALLHLTLDAPASALPIRRAAVAPRAGARVRIVGFGIGMAGEIGGTLERRFGLAELSTVASSTFVTRPSPSSPCNHDSGGAALDESGALLGVVSAGDLACTYAVFTRTDVHSKFIESTIAAWEKGAPVPDAPPGACVIGAPPRRDRAGLGSTAILAVLVVAAAAGANRINRRLS